MFAEEAGIDNSYADVLAFDRAVPGLGPHRDRAGCVLDMPDYAAFIVIVIESANFAI
jgi:hypothetical protein